MSTWINMTVLFGQIFNACVCRYAWARTTQSHLQLIPCIPLRYQWTRRSLKYQCFVVCWYYYSMNMSLIALFAACNLYSYINDFFSVTYDAGIPYSVIVVLPIHCFSLSWSMHTRIRWTEDHSNVILTWYIVFSFRDDAFLIRLREVEVSKNRGDLPELPARTLCC
jgi:hypothetical protein